MRLQTLVVILAMCLCYGCDNKKGIQDYSKEEMNTLLGNVNLDDPVFVQKDIQFDSVLTLAGIREINGGSERIKCKLFFFDHNMRGYFNLADQDDKNLQVFGKRVDDYYVLKSATKINMEESDGFLILDKKYNGIWSNGSVNFVNGTISMTKQKTDYTSLKAW